MSFGLNLSNLGPKITYIDAAQADPLPTNLRLGISAQVIKSEFNNLNFVVDLTGHRICRIREVVPVSAFVYAEVFG